MCGSEIRLSIESSSRLKKTTEHCTVVVRERSTGPHGENTMNDVHNTHDFPLLFGKPPLFGKPSKVPKKTLPGPKKVTDMTQKKAFLRHTHKNIFCKKNGQKTAICCLSSGQTILPQPIRGHSHQLDDRHRNPNIREIIWLGNQLPWHLRRLSVTEYISFTI